MPRPWPSRRRGASRSTRPPPPRSRGSSGRDARARRDPLHPQARCVPLADAGGSRHRGEGPAGAVPGRQDAGGARVLASPPLRRAPGLAPRRLGRHARVRRRSARPGHGVAHVRQGARVPRGDRAARHRVRLSEAPHELPARGRGARRVLALLPRPGAARPAQAGRHGRRRRDAGPGVQADRGEAALADDLDRDGRRHVRRAWLGDGCAARDGRGHRDRGALRGRALADPREDRRVLQGAGIPAQVAVEERMGCGLGLCQTCVVPVARKDGSGYDHLRSCVDGPVFNPARVLWDRWLSEEPTMLPTPPEGLPVVRSWPG